jgi:hypothetical protein
VVSPLKCQFYAMGQSAGPPSNAPLLADLVPKARGASLRRVRRAASCDGALEGVFAAPGVPPPQPTTASASEGRCRGRTPR